MSGSHGRGNQKGVGVSRTFPFPALFPFRSQRMSRRHSLPQTVAHYSLSLCVAHRTPCTVAVRRRPPVRPPARRRGLVSVTGVAGRTGPRGVTGSSLEGAGTEGTPTGRHLGSGWRCARGRKRVERVCSGTYLVISVLEDFPFRRGTILSGVIYSLRLVPKNGTREE